MKAAPNKYRVRDGELGTDDTYGMNGYFRVPYKSVVLRVIVSDGADWAETGMPGEPWEHVSVSLPDRCPKWDEMEFIARMFWDNDETLVQFHVPRKDHINRMPYCLHIWKPPYAVPLPPSNTVG